MRKKFVSKTILIMLLIIFAFSAISNIVYAINEEQNENSTELILSNYERELVDINQPIETEIVTDQKVLFPTINEYSLNLINELDIEISENDEIKKIYDKSIDREVTRVISDDAEIDFDNTGNIVTFKNLDDYSTEDKNKRNYIEGEALPTITYEITSQTDLTDVISQVDDLYNLSNYELVDCSNNIKEAWILTWCRDYGNNLINPYECINLVVDAKDGSITILGKNSMEPNATVAVITADQASAIANPILKIDCDDIEASHACAIGSLNDDHLFYLLSRGIALEDAKKLITYGYLNPIVNYFDDEDKEELENLIKKEF